MAIPFKDAARSWAEDIVNTGTDVNDVRIPRQGTIVNSSTGGELIKEPACARCRKKRVKCEYNYSKSYLWKLSKAMDVHVFVEHLLVRKSKLASAGK